MAKETQVRVPQDLLEEARKKFPEAQDFSDATLVGFLIRKALKEA